MYNVLIECVGYDVLVDNWLINSVVRVNGIIGGF